MRVTNAIGITDNETVMIKKREGANGKATEIIKQGDNFHRDSGEWRKRRYVVDRKNHRYTERIVDPTGKVVYERAEPLSKHQGHGSARKARPNDG